MTKINLQNKRLRSAQFLHTYLIIILGIIVYCNSFSVGWYFDGMAIQKIFKNLDGYGQIYHFTGIDGASYIGYIGWFSFFLNQFIHVNYLWEFHLINLIIHIANAILVYNLTILTFSTPYFKNSPFNNKYQNRYIALLAGTLFVSHPITSQSVTYLYQRFTSLATLFYMFTIFFYLKARLFKTLKDKSSKKIGFYFIAFIVTNMGLYTKHQLITIPLVLLLCEIYFFPVDKKEKWQKRFVSLFPFFIAVLCRVLWFDFYLFNFTSSADKAIVINSPNAAVFFHIPRLTYLFTEFRVIITYLRLLFFPANQTLLYDYPYSFSLFNPPTFVSFCLLLGLFIFTIRIFKHFRFVSFYIVWFFINIAVTSSIIPERQVIFEHRLYLPAIGIIIAVSTLLVRFYFITKEKKRIYCRIVSIMILIIVCLHSALLIKRNCLWLDETILLEDMLKKAPNNVLVLAQLGNNYLTEGKKINGEQLLKKALLLHPSSKHALPILGRFYIKEKRFKEALILHQNALEFMPSEEKNLLPTIQNISSLVKMSEKGIL